VFLFEGILYNLSYDVFFAGWRCKIEFLPVFTIPDTLVTMNKQCYWISNERIIESVKRYNTGYG